MVWGTKSVQNVSESNTIHLRVTEVIPSGLDFDLHTAAVFLFGFFMVKRFMRSWQKTSGPSRKRTEKQIPDPDAAENPMLVIPWLGYGILLLEQSLCSFSSVWQDKAYAHACRRALGSSPAGRGHRDGAPSEFPSVRIPCHMWQMTAGESGLPIEDMEAHTAIVVLWNQAIPSPARDRVVFALSNDFSVQ